MNTTILLLLIVGALLFLYILEIVNPNPNGNGRTSHIERSIRKHIHVMNTLDKESLAIQYLVPCDKNSLWNILRKKLKIHLYQYTYAYKDADNFKKRFSNITLIMPRNKYFHLMLIGQVNTTNKKMAQKTLDKINCKWKLP